MSAHDQQLLKTEQTLADDIKAAKERIARLERDEIERTRRDEQAATRDLRKIENAYPSTPEIGKRSYQARQQRQAIENQYQFKYGAIRDKYEAMMRQQQDEIHRKYESEIAAIKSGAANASSDDEVPRAIVVASPEPTPLSGGNLYFVVGITEGDFLNVRSGPGMSYGIVARLPNGYKGLRIMGSPVLNGTTEWVQVALDNQTGWVTKLYLKAE